MSIDLSLDRLSRLLQHIQPYTRPTIHVAGTNGKGSVTAMLSSILRSSQPPLSVGRFNSPHLVTVRDCIVINDEMVSDKRYSEARQLVEEADLEHGTKLTHFEILTATALLVFELEKVDIVIAEVGLGGRLDATNTIPDEAICVSALTSVGLDHQKFLGDTPAAIAREKAGIARRGKPFVLGKQEYAEVKDVTKEVVRNVGGNLVEAVQVLERDWDLDFDGERPRYIHLSSDDFVQPPPQPVSLPMPCFSKPLRTLLPLYGHHQLDNLAIASTIVSTLLTHPSCRHLNLKDSITETSVDRGIREIRLLNQRAFHPELSFVELCSPLLYPHAHAFDMTTSKDDRDAMNLLHEVSHGALNTSRNYRDASGPSNLWRQKPTKISLPMNQNTPKPLGKTPGKATRPFKHNALDPYGNHRSGGRSSNPVASATYMSKRQKTDYAYRDALSKPSFQTPRHEAPRLPPDDIMMVEDDSEDLGEPILRHPRVPNLSLPSPDPLDVLGERTSQKSCRATALGQKPPTPVGQHPFDSKPIKPLSIGTSNHTHGQLSSDPVEDSFVRSQADRINTNSRKPNVPHLDLKAKAKAKDKMKSKQGSLKITPQYQRSSGRASKLSKGDEEGDLVAAVEVKVAYVGVQEESTPGMNVTLKKQDGDLRLSIMNVKISSPTSTLLGFNVATDISQIKMTKPDVEEKTLALQLVTQSKYSGRPRDTYKPGHEDLGRLLFIFDSEHRSDYRALFEGLKHTVKDSQYLGLSATKPMIEAYQLTAHAVAQSYAKSPSSGLPTRQPTSKPASGVKRRLSPDSEFVIPDYTPSSSNSTNLPTRRSARQSLQKDPVQIPKTDPEEIILVYPPNTTGAVTITTSDLMRLQPGEFLNDTLIEFGLKLWLKDLEDTRPELAKDVHVFNSFFYKKLKVRNIAEGYQSVRKWTSKFDLFQKKYLIVPINEKYVIFDAHTLPG
ncbi:hypothetical protein ONZ45_g17915 [Pleurotus djamor]|nr:hypothetical protein ONZ45_g17915 [Pleurotus djamor]